MTEQTLHIPVLDKGYVRFIESWGSDERIIESARMSTDGSFREWGPIHTADCLSKKVRGDRSGGRIPEPITITPCDCLPTSGDEKLLRYLYTHKHMTPFEMCGMTIEVKAPIMVFREWHRHRTQSYNEMSARYIPLPDEDYLPTVARCKRVDVRNKQAAASVGKLGNNDMILGWLKNLEILQETAEALYNSGLDIGIPKEIARLAVTVSRYSKMRASANLRNWLAFLTLRMDNAAQEEIRQYANVVGVLIEERFPRTWRLFIEEFNSEE